MAIYNRRVTEVIDGDTFHLSSPIRYLGKSYSRVRIKNLNAADLSNQRGVFAKNALRRLIAGKTVTIDFHRELNYDRIVADVSVNGKLVKDLL